MKKWKVGALSLALAMLLGGCAIKEEELPQTNADTLDPKAERIAALESELTSLKEKEVLYQEQITTLEQRLKALSAGTPAQDPLTETVTFHYRVDGGNAIITGYSGNASILNLPETLNGLPVTAIAEHAFEKATLTAVILPEGITSIGWFAFYECKNLAGVTIPASVTSIGHAVFDGCAALTLHCPADSFSARYAQSYGIPYTTS